MKRLGVECAITAGEPGRVGFSSAVQFGTGSSKRGGCVMSGDLYARMPLSKSSIARCASCCCSISVSPWNEVLKMAVIMA